jgi:putative glutamine amidotransferase
MRVEHDTHRYYLGRDYSHAVEAAGGLPVHIPLIADKGYIASLVDGLDGILLPGCDSDVDPSYYGEDPHPKLGRVVPEKDETDLLVLEEVERLNLPLLAICYGVQILNVSRGGSLIQDIHEQVENPLKHRQGEPVARNSHEIKVERDSLLFELSRKGEDEKVRVNSHHHQAVRQPGSNLQAVAWANDGVIEGIQDVRPERFVLGVQWHPELSWSNDGFSRAIFETFVSACSLNAAGESFSDIASGALSSTLR